MSAPTQIDLKGQGLATVRGLTIVVDPKDDKVKDKNRKTPANSGPTKDKHRYTVCAATDDESIVNVGMGNGDWVKGSCSTLIKNIKDTGITGRTKSHIHWETTGEKTEGTTDTRTIVSLGKGAQDAFIESKFDPKAPKSTVGYTMVTQGPSFSNSRQQYYVVSDEGDVQVRASKANVNLQATEQSVSIEAGKNVSISAKGGSATIGAVASLKPEDRRWNVAIESAIGKALSDKHLKQQMKALAVAQGIFSFSQKFQVPGYEALFGSKGWKGISWADAPKFVADSAKLVSTLGRMGLKHWDTQGKVGVTGETYASLSGGVATSIYGGLSASITSLLSVGMLGIASAGMKGVGWASVWSGIGTSIKSLKDVGVEAQLGKAKLKAMQDVSVESRSAKVTIAGEKGVQVKADEGNVYLYSGLGGVEAVSGRGAGFAMGVTEEEAWMTKIASNANNFSEANSDKQKFIRITDKGIGLRHGKSGLELENDGVINLYGKKGWAWKVGDDLSVSGRGKILFQ